MAASAALLASLASGCGDGAVEERGGDSGSTASAVTTTIQPVTVTEVPAALGLPDDWARDADVVRARGVVDYQGGGTHNTYRFDLASDGSYRIDQSDDSDTVMSTWTYDAAALEYTSVHQSAEPGLPAMVTVGHGRPTAGSFAIPGPLGAVLASLRGVEFHENLTVASVEVGAGGSRVATLEGSLAYLAGDAGPDSTADVSVSVHEDTGLVVALAVEYPNGTETWSVSDLEAAVDAAPAGTYSLDVSGYPLVNENELGFARYGNLGEVASRAQYEVLAPAGTPDGFESADVLFAERTRLRTDQESTNTDASDVVTLVYRRGLDWIAVSQYPIPPGEEVRDPFRRDVYAESEGSRSVTLADGREVEVTTVEGLTTGAGLWFAVDGMLVSVSGTVPMEELVAVASSLDIVE